MDTERTKPTLGTRIRALIRQEFERRGDPPRRFDRTRKALVLLIGILMIGSIVVITARATQSSFRLRSFGDSDVYLDKYLGTERAKVVMASIQRLTEGFYADMGIDRAGSKHPGVYFFTDRHYGIISASDRLLSKRIGERNGSDLNMLRTVSFNLYANELAADSITSRDGNYVFVTVGQDWEKALVHAETHASAAGAMPESLRRVTSADANFDAEAWYAFRFVDEVVAVFASELYALSAKAGGPEAAAAAYRSSCAPIYDPETGLLAQKEYFIWMATYDPPSKSAEFFWAAFDFGAFLQDRLGYRAMAELTGRFMRGDYQSLDELFAAVGGLPDALKAWSGSQAVPR